MKRLFTLLPWFALIIAQSSQAVVSSFADAQKDATKTPAHAAPMPANSNPPTTSTQKAFIDNLPKNSASLTPQQGQELLKQAKNLNPDQLQAIARSFQQQLEPVNQVQVETISATVTPTPEPPPNVFNPGMQKEHSRAVDDLKREQAFNLLMQDVLPLSPDQITKMHKFYDLTLQAKATTAQPSPTPNFVSYPVQLEPGSLPPIIRLAAGFVSTLLFVDSSGAAWPLTAYSIGDPTSFNISWDQKGHAVFIQSLKPYATGNLAVRLWGLDTPVMLTLVSGQRNVDFRVDLQVPGHGPEARPPVLDTTFNAQVNPVLINILDGVPPRGSIKLEVVGGQGDAWLVDNKIYFRSRLTVLSPAWVATVASPDGTHVYEMMITPYILASQNGKTVDIKLSGL